MSGPFPVDQAAIDRAVTAAADFVASSRFGAGALVGVSTAAEVVTAILFGAVVLFYFLKDGGRIWAFSPGRSTAITWPGCAGRES